MPESEDLTPADCRAFAASARRQAALASAESDRVAWMKIAQEWEQIATALEQIRAETSPSDPPSLH